MKRARSLLPYVFVALASGGLVVALTQGEAATDDRQAQFDDMGARMEALDARVRRLRNQPRPIAVNRTSAQSAPSAEVVSEPTAVEPSSPDESGLTEQQREEQYFTRLDDRISREGQDHDWSIQAEGAIVETVSAMAGTTLHTARCQATMCRVEVSFDDPEAQERFMDEAPVMPPFDTRGTMRFSDADFGSEATIYIARAGHESEVFEES